MHRGLWICSCEQSCARCVLGPVSWSCPAQVTPWPALCYFAFCGILHCSCGCWANEVGQRLRYVQSKSCILSQETAQSKHCEAAFPLLLVLTTLFRPLLWLLYFLFFHRLFISEISQTSTRYSCVVEQLCPSPCNPNLAVLLKPIVSCMCKLLGSFWVDCLTGFHRCVLQEMVTCLTNP